MSVALGALAERLDDFDRVDFLHQRAEHGRLVAAAGADLQHAVGRLRVELLGHVGDDERRRDRLLVADRQGHVEVGELRAGWRARTRAAACRASLEDALVLDAGGGDFLVDQLVGELTPIAERLG